MDDGEGVSAPVDTAALLRLLADALVAPQGQRPQDGLAVQVGAAEHHLLRGLQLLVGAYAIDDADHGLVSVRLTGDRTALQVRLAVDRLSIRLVERVGADLQVALAAALRAADARRHAVLPDPPADGPYADAVDGARGRGADPCRVVLLEVGGDGSVAVRLDRRARRLRPRQLASCAEEAWAVAARDLSARLEERLAALPDGDDDVGTDPGHATLEHLRGPHPACGHDLT